MPVTYIKSLTQRTQERILSERARGAFASLADFHRRVKPLPEEMETLIRAGALDGFGSARTAQFWEAQFLRQAAGPGVNQDQEWLLAPPNPAGQITAGVVEPECGRPRPQQRSRDGRLSNQAHACDRSDLAATGDGRTPVCGTPQLQEPTFRDRLQWETELLGFPVSAHPLALYEDIAWDTYCPVSKLGAYVGQRVVACGLVIEQRLHHQATGEPMKFLTLADWTGLVETELFAPTYRSYGLTTVRYPVLEVEATVEPFENGRGFSLRVHRAGQPRTKIQQASDLR